MYHKTWVKENQSRFNSTYQSLPAFGGHRLHYQVHISTNNCLQELINNLLNLQITYPIAINKKLSKFYNRYHKTKIETIPGSKYSY